jgi:hypothetical protein
LRTCEAQRARLAFSARLQQPVTGSVVITIRAAHTETRVLRKHTLKEVKAHAGPHELKGSSWQQATKCRESWTKSGASKQPSIDTRAPRPWAASAACGKRPSCCIVACLGSVQVFVYDTAGPVARWRINSKFQIPASISRSPNIFASMASIIDFVCVCARASAV